MFSEMVCRTILFCDHGDHMSTGPRSRGETWTTWSEPKLGVKIEEKGQAAGVNDEVIISLVIALLDIRMPADADKSQSGDTTHH